MSLQFIDNASINKKTRSLIRSHVAKGKNLGRTIHRPSRHARRRQVAASIVSTSKPLSNTEPESYNNENLDSALSVRGHLQGDLSNFPFDVSQACRRLFHRFIAYMNVAAYPPQLTNTVINVTGPRLFLQYAFVDEAFFHCVVAMSVTAAVSMPVTRQETTEALCHLSRSLRLVNQRLGGEQELALSDTTIGSVIVMIQLERLLGYHRHALVHFDGLQKLIALRGGIGTLFLGSPGIAQKALRADFDFALQFGSSAIFDGECLLSKDTLNWLHEEYRGSQATSPDTSASVFIACNPDLRRVCEDISMLAWLVDYNEVNGIRVDDYEFHNLLLLVGYRLLKIRPLNSSIEFINRLDLLLHLGLAALMSRFFATLGVKALDVLLLRRCIVSAISGRHYDDKEEQELVLWLLLLGKTSVFRDEDEDIWLIPKISQVATQLDLSTWDHVLATVKKFPWVRIFSDDIAQTLWNRIGSPFPILF